MDNLLSNIDELITVIIAVLVAVQSLVVYFLSPEKAEKWNWLGKALSVLAKTKAGISTKAPEDGKVSSTD
jgi:hypothetical protein